MSQARTPEGKLVFPLSGLSASTNVDAATPVTWTASTRSVESLCLTISGCAGTRRRRRHYSNALMSRRRHAKRPLPGFGLTLGFTVSYLSIVVLLPLSALLVESGRMGWTDFWHVVSSPQVVAAYRLTLGRSPSADEKERAEAFLRESPLSELCRELDMTRQAVTKHLAILEAANLVATRRRGREKLHFINPVPINEIAERWIGKFDRPRLAALSDLKRSLEGDDHR